MGMKKRAALFLSMGEPYLNHLWLDMFKKNGLDDVDVVHVAIDPKHDGIPAANHDYFIKLFSGHSKIKIHHSDKVGLHSALRTLFANCYREKYYVLIQDDCFVIKKHGLVPYFAQIESGFYDILGQPMRNYGPQEFHNQLIEQYAGDDKDCPYYPFKNAGYSLWQNMVFGKTQDMLETGIKFKHGGWPAGTKVPYLDKPIGEKAAIDIFVPEILMHRTAGKKFGYINQCFLSRDDLQDYLNLRGVFNGMGAWVHLGTMSNFYGDLAQMREQEETHDPSIILENERRVAWYLLMQEWYPEVKKELPRWAKQVDDYLKYLCRHFEKTQMYGDHGFNKRNLQTRMKIYRELLQK